MPPPLFGSSNQPKNNLWNGQDQVNQKQVNDQLPEGWGKSANPWLGPAHACNGGEHGEPKQPQPQHAQRIAETSSHQI